MSELTPERIAAIEAKYQAELTGPMSKNHDKARYAARAKIERDYALGEITKEQRAKALQDEFDSASNFAMGGGDLSLKYNSPWNEGPAYDAIRPKHLPSLI